MSDELARFVMSERTTKASSDALVVYLVLRSDIVTNATVTTKFAKSKGNLVSGFTVGRLVKHTGLVQPLVEKALDELIRLVWIRRVVMDGCDAYQLGDIVDDGVEWFAQITDGGKPGVAKQIMQFVQEKKSREREAFTPKPRKATPGLRRKLAGGVMKGLGTDTKPSAQVLQHFKTLYAHTFDESFLVAEEGEDYGREYRKAYSLTKKSLSLCDGSVICACEFLNFLFSDWEKIKAALSWEGRPTLELIATPALVRNIKSWMDVGIPEVSVAVSSDGVAKRFDAVSAKDAPDEGF